MTRKEHISDASRLIEKIASELYAVRNIPAGVPILESYVSSSEIVKSGSRVTIMIEKGTLKLRLAGRTVEKAAIGTLVRVKPVRGTKELIGMLVEKDVVSIEH
jgi:flagella basal body P-ring formation protein FlgA